MTSILGSVVMPRLYCARGKEDLLKEGKGVIRVLESYSLTSWRPSALQ